MSAAGALRRLRGPASLALAVAIAAAGVAVVGACSNESSKPGVSGCPTAEPQGTPIDARVMAFLSAARALHHEADMHERSGDARGALAPLEHLVALPAPTAVEVDEVLADTHARLAELRLGLGDLEGAGRDIQAGLLRVRGPTYFRGHLLEVEGLIEEARAAGLADAGHGDQAAAVRARAMALLEEAVRVQQQVIEHALPDADGG
jgi:hypothetical protein